MANYKVKGKMVKHEFLWKRRDLRPFLPETHWLTVSKAISMLKSYPTIFIKPNGGSGGTGILKIRQIRSGFELFDGPRRRLLDTSALNKTLFAYQRSPQKYIVQRGLSLGCFRGTIFDVRMYLQKPDKEWLISGMVARVAAPHRYVTNHHKGGHAEALEKVLADLFADNMRRVKHCRNTLRKTALIVAGTLDKRFPDLRELGIDLGIEKNGRVWFIEANSRPLHRLFTQLSDKTMLHRIRKNKRLIRLSQ